MKNIMKLFLVCTVFFICMMPVSAVEIDMDHMSDDEASVLTEQFKKLGIEEETATMLTDKYLSGQKLDCMNGKYSEMEPLAVTESEGFYEALYEYPDGSRKLVSISAGITQYISGGTYYSGGNWYTWNNALVYGSNGVMSVSFRANMAGSAYDGHLISVSSLSYSGTGITQSYFGVNNAYAASAVPANGGFYGVRNGMSISLLVYVPMGGSPYAVFSC